MATEKWNPKLCCLVRPVIRCTVCNRCACAECYKEHFKGKWFTQMDGHMSHRLSVMNVDGDDFRWKRAAQR